MRILAISGSLQATGTITTLVRAIVALAPEEMECTVYSGLGDLPHFSPDRDSDPPPASVGEWRGLLRASDAVLICTPEYAYGMPGSLKNAFDWVVSSGEFVGKPVAALSASPYPTGGERAHASLLLTLTAVNAEIVDGATLSIPLVRTKMDAEGTISDPATAQALRSALDALVQAINAHHDEGY
ncbi:MAG: NAD(P)H-dependent oxidoreductase [Chloroflexota bacterium]|nr:NAD(P)H-dependent oxidoreductase [Chloroflexota bacterium]MDQ6905323.1 NAD(P)H-dependent oxidoreductase [Chloroflexota bacterium]